MANLLELTTLAPERPTIGIDGTAYELAVPDDFDLLKQVRLDRLQRRVSSLIEAPEPATDEASDERVQTMQAALREVVGIVLPSAPAEVRAKLSDVQNLGIMQAFTGAVGARAKARTPRPPKSTGEKRSPASSASTAATQEPGRG